MYSTPEICMAQRLHLLETFFVRGSDGVSYKICGYEQMVRDESFASADERWEPTGVAEYRTSEGDLVDVQQDGSMRINRTGVSLRREAAELATST